MISTKHAISTGKQFLNHVVPSVARPVGIIWNQAIGFIFIVLALVPIPGAIHILGKDGSGPRIGLTVCFVLIMGWFGVSSFWRARKISKS